MHVKPGNTERVSCRQADHHGGPRKNIRIQRHRWVFPGSGVGVESTRCMVALPGDRALCKTTLTTGCALLLSYSPWDSSLPRFLLALLGVVNYPQPEPPRDDDAVHSCSILSSLTGGRALIRYYPISKMFCSTLVCSVNCSC